MSTLMVNARSLILLFLFPSSSLTQESRPPVLLQKAQPDPHPLDRPLPAQLLGHLPLGPLDLLPLGPLDQLDLPPLDQLGQLDQDLPPVAQAAQDQRVLSLAGLILMTMVLAFVFVARDSTNLARTAWLVLLVESTVKETLTELVNALLDTVTTTVYVLNVLLELSGALLLRPVFMFADKMLSFQIRLKLVNALLDMD